MTKPTDNGRVVERAYDDIEEALLQGGDKLAVIIADILDGGENSQALKAAVALVQDNAQLLRVVGLLRQKNYPKAELAAMRLAASDKGALKP